MLRLRTTAALSALALAIGVVGTQWLSDRGDDGAMASLAGESPISPRPLHRPPMLQRLPAPVDRRPVHATQAARVRGASASEITENAAPVAPLPALTPLDMPMEGAGTYETLRGHLDGRVVMHLSVDGQGQVIEAEVAQSSGDAVLDAHALRSVRGWRFAVPPDHARGLSGDLPMQFSSHDTPVAGAP